MHTTLVKCVFVLCVVLNCEVSGQICRKRTVTTKWVYEDYTYQYADRYSKKNWFGKTVYKTRLKTASGTKPVPKQEVEFVPTCCDGYIRTDSGSLADIECTPICTPACENGQCVSPGECECHAGYILEVGSPHKCVPTCGICLHGTCVAPNVCRCDYGYSEQNGTSCLPICSEPCVNSACVAPGTCQCHYGYRKTDGNLCTPYCSRGCVHGTCTEPETCTCDNGWQKAEIESCVPKCDVPCGNGTCVEPNNCNCNEGYKIDEENNPICVPHCKKSCGNGVCVAPDTCECEPGYNVDNDKEPMCEPQCQIECGNGTCIEPNRCACHTGFKVSIGNPVCVTHCDIQCGNGTCVSPNQCECHTGYQIDRESNPICTPKCDVKCGNGTCVGPNKCECETGYKADKNKDPICAPHCAFECGNGSCIAPNLCKCDIGYEFTTDSSTCVPKCDNCRNGICVAPNVCVCNAGFELGQGNYSKCVPRCDPKCGNGSCIAPNTCRCFVGYKLDKDKLGCEPDCGECGGKCLIPHKCECDLPLTAIPLKTNGSECADEIYKCQRIICVETTTFGHISYGYDDIETTDVEPQSGTAGTATIAYNYEDYAENYADYAEGVIVNGSILREADVENQIQGSESWMQSKWEYAVIATVAIILAIIIGSLIIFRKTLFECCKGSGAYEVEDDENGGAGATHKGKKNKERKSDQSMRLSTIMKNRDNTSSNNV